MHTCALCKHIGICPAVPQSVCTTHWSKETKRQDVAQPWLCTLGEEHVHECCQRNTSGCLSGVTGDGVGNPPPTSLHNWIWIVSCSRLCSFCFRWPCFSIFSGVSEAGSGLSWLFPPPTSFDQHHREKKERTQSCAARGLVTIWNSFFHCCMLEATLYTFACFSSSQPAKKIRKKNKKKKTRQLGEEDLINAPLDR